MASSPSHASTRHGPHHASPLLHRMGEPAAQGAATKGCVGQRPPYRLQPLILVTPGHTREDQPAPAVSGDETLSCSQRQSVCRQPPGTACFGGGWARPFVAGLGDFRLGVWDLPGWVSPSRAVPTIKQVCLSAVLLRTEAHTLSVFYQLPVPTQVTVLLPAVLGTSPSFHPGDWDARWHRNPCGRHWGRCPLSGAPCPRPMSSLSQQQRSAGKGCVGRRPASGS